MKCETDLLGPFDAEECALTDCKEECAPVDYKYQDEFIRIWMDDHMGLMVEVIKPRKEHVALYVKRNDTGRLIADANRVSDQEGNHFHIYDQLTQWDYEIIKDLPEEEDEGWIVVERDSPKTMETITNVSCVLLNEYVKSLSAAKKSENCFKEGFSKQESIIEELKKELQAAHETIVDLENRPAKKQYISSSKSKHMFAAGMSFASKQKE